jgi:hypothetical protein
MHFKLKTTDNIATYVESLSRVPNGLYDEIK